MNQLEFSSWSQIHQHTKALQSTSIMEPVKLDATGSV